MAESFDTVMIRRLQKGQTDRFWKAVLRGATLTTTSGDVGTEGETTTKKYRTPYEAYVALMDDETDKANRDYFNISEEELQALQKEGAASTKKPAAPPAPSVGPAVAVPKIQSTGKPAPPPATSTGAKVKAVKRAGPFADALTGEVIHRFKLQSAKSNAAGAPRATSGGRAIMAAGQNWPICTYCDKPLGLYLQFDIEERHQLAFASGSHVLLFHCLHTDHVPPTFSGRRVPKAWLDPDFRSTYRVVLNPPGVTEVVYEPDPMVREQQLAFVAGKEKLSEGLDGPIGQGDVKMGGVPCWEQPPFYPQCACGKPMGFIMQVPTDESPGWKSTRGSRLPFAGGLNAYIFACSAQSSPYGTVLVAQR